MTGSIRWILLIPVAVIALVVIVFGGLAFFAALLEKRRLVVWMAKELPRGRRVAPSLEHARSHGFHDIGCFTEPTAFMAGYANVLISPDQRVLAMTVHGRVTRFKLISTLPDGRWLITSDSGGEPDLSGLQLHEWLPTYFPYILEYHYRRLQRLNVEPGSFDTTTAMTDLLDHDRLRAASLQAGGLARWRDEQQSCWSYTFNGACRMSIAMLSQMFSVSEARRVAQAEGFPLKS